MKTVNIRAPCFVNEHTYTKRKKQGVNQCNQNNATDPGREDGE